MPCFLAGVRDANIGTDVYTYAIWMFQNALHADLFGFLQSEASIAASGWNAMTWFAANITGSFEAYLFIIEALCIVPIYFCLKRFAPGAEWAGIAVWLLLFYALSLNLMRQSIAIAFVFYSFSFIKDRSLIKFVACIIVAMLFHQTAAIGFALYPLAWLILREEALSRLLGKWKGMILAVSIIAGLSFLFVYGEQFVLMFSSLKESYSYQVQHLGGDISLSSLYLLAECLIIWIIAKNDFSDHGLVETGPPIAPYRNTHASAVAVKQSESVTKRESVDVGFRLALIFAIIGNLLAQLDFVSNTLGRLGLYGSIFACMAAATLAANQKESRGHVSLMIVMCILYFIIMTIMLGKSEVYPYSSAILGI